ncbi:MAG: hypothetical protein ACYDHU_05235 [Acidimicrobiales bacterium]
MRRSSGVPILVLCLLIGLSAGAAVLGLRQAPPAADLALHNAAGETLAAASLSAVYKSASGSEVVGVKYRAPDLVTETLVKGGPLGAPPEVAHITGAKALGALSPVSQLLKINGFSSRGSTYVGSEPISSLITAAEARLVSGSIRYTVTVDGGYVIKVVEHEVVTTPGGSQSGGGTYRIGRIGNQRVPFG